MAQDVLLFELDGHCCAIPASDIHLVTGAVTIHPLPGAPAVVSGVINVRGDIVPVIDIRLRLGLEPRPVRASDHFVVVHQAGRLLAFPVDRVIGLKNAPVGEASGAAFPDHSGGIVKLAEGLAVLYDLSGFLSNQETGELGDALARK